MTRRQDVDVPPYVVRQARSAGVRGDVRARVQAMAAASKPVQCHPWNRVHGDFYLIVRGMAVAAIMRAGPVYEHERTEQDCRLCAGTCRVVRVTPDGGRVSRVCPRALDRTAPVCDEVQ